MRNFLYVLSTCCYHLTEIENLIILAVLLSLAKNLFVRRHVIASRFLINRSLTFYKVYHYRLIKRR